MLGRKQKGATGVIVFHAVLLAGVVYFAVNYTPSEPSPKPYRNYFCTYCGALREEAFVWGRWKTNFPETVDVWRGRGHPHEHDFVWCSGFDGSICSDGFGGPAGEVFSGLSARWADGCLDESLIREWYDVDHRDLAAVYAFAETNHIRISTKRIRLGLAATNNVPVYTIQGKPVSLDEMVRLIGRLAEIDADQLFVMEISGDTSTNAWMDFAAMCRDKGLAALTIFVTDGTRSMPISIGQETSGASASPWWGAYH